MGMVWYGIFLFHTLIAITVGERSPVVTQYCVSGKDGVSQIQPKSLFIIIICINLILHEILILSRSRLRVTLVLLQLPLHMLTPPTQPVSISLVMFSLGLQILFLLPQLIAPSLQPLSISL